MTTARWGSMWVSAVAAGEPVGLRLRLYGEKGHIAWEQSDPDKLKFALQGEASHTLLRGQSGLSAIVNAMTRQTLITKNSDPNHADHLSFREFPSRRLPMLPRDYSIM